MNPKQRVFHRLSPSRKSAITAGAAQFSAQYSTVEIVDVRQTRRSRRDAQHDERYSSRGTNSVYAVWKSRKPCPVLFKVEKSSKKESKGGKNVKIEKKLWNERRKERECWERERERERETWKAARVREEHANLLNYKIILPYDYYVRYTLYILYLCLNNRC